MSHSPCHILYVDDEPGLLDIGKLFLETGAEFSVHTSHSAIEALNTLESTRYDAIVSDYQMPKMDGLAFLKTLRAGGNTTPFIIFTGRGREEVVIEALNSGADFYIQKGGDPTAQFAELAHKIRRAVAKREADLALAQSERDYRHLIEHAGQAIYVVQDGLIQMTNPRAAELTGYPEAELLGQPFVGFVHPEDRDLLLDRFKKRMEGEEVPSCYTFRARRKDGTDRWAELNVVVIAWNGQPATLNFLNDVTERKRAEDALKESEERYRQFFQTSLDSIFVTTPDGKWIDFNDATVKMFGCRDRDDLFDRPITTFYVQIEDRAAIVRRVEQEGYVKEYPLSYRRKDGTVFDALMTVVVRRNPDGSTKFFIGTLRDVTERKRTHDALKASKAALEMTITQLNEAQRIATLGSWTFDPDRGSPAWSEETFRVFGLDPEQGVPTYAEFRDLVHPDQRPILDETVTAAKTAGKGYSLELRIKRPDGKERIIHQQCELIAGSANHGPYILGTSQDITDRVKTGEALRESEERYRQFFKTTLDCVFITSPEGRFIDVNDALVKLHGNRTYEEMLDVDVASVWDRPEDRKAFLETVTREGCIREYPLRFKRQDGSIVDTLISIASQKNPDGTVRSFIGTVRDITDSKRAERALRESEERYRHIFESFEDLYYQADDKGVITLLSPSLYTLTGWRADELIGKPITTIYVNPADRTALLDEIARNGHVRDYEVLLLKRDGTKVPVSLSANRIFHADGAPAGIAGIIRDITRRKRAEEAMRESEEKFRSLVDDILEGILILDFQGAILFANRVAARALAMDDPAALTGRNAMEFIAPESREEAIRDLRRVAGGDDGFFAYYLAITATGEKINIGSIGKIIAFEGQAADLISIRKVSGRHALPGFPGLQQP